MPSSASEEAMGDSQSQIGNELAEGTGLEPASDKCAVVFGTTALPLGYPSVRKLCFELRSVLCKVQSTKYKVRFLVHVVGLAPTKDNQVRLISKEGAFAAQPHMQVRSQISNSRFQMISNLSSIYAKK